ncbi:HTH-type transcriptional repressor KstR2 [Thalassovita mediterranea]|jgi:AcrR family transcriptional regulator|uniref:HTH-type transcriptional repressor KstR2 n=2 Tax=Thalassovita mediterranea TaxID=340021 RepID=A0A0P1GSS0_9RHOB|nr:HTH-type transcriptional repressor KstR2 [Thalassovita mediterranea]SIS29745.1 transcriptional regulator, TetR family [Thalassovita mediterranea]
MSVLPAAFALGKGIGCAMQPRSALLCRFLYDLNICSVSVVRMARTAGSHSDITGPRVLDAALRLFAQHGFAAVSMRQIAREVGVQAGALYNYTPDKQTLLFDLMRRHMEDLLEQRQDRLSAADPLSRLEDFARFHIRYHLNRPDEVFIAYMELRNLTEENFATIEELRRRYEAELEEILRDGVAAGLFVANDIRITTMAVIAMLTGVTTWYRPSGRLSGDEVELLYWDMVRKSVSA